MTPLQTLQAALQRQPADLTVWLAIADALEEEGQGERAEHTRLWLAEVASQFRLPTNPERRRELERQRVTLPLPEYTNSIGMRLAWIPPGKFLMGASRELDPNAYSYELGQYAHDEYEGSPRHEVTLTKAFYMGIHEVTQEQWAQVMGQVRGGGNFQFMNTPIYMINWHQAMEFCKRLSELPEEKEKGYSYRLPTEAEWEYACRGGGVEFSLYHFGNTITKDDANFDRNVGDLTEVGKYAPNAFGLYDMHGNVWEYCADTLRIYQDRSETDPHEPAGDARRVVVRGGSWRNDEDMCKSSNRIRTNGNITSIYAGFRVACDLKK